MNYINKNLQFFSIVLILIFTLNFTAKAKEVDYEIVKKVALNAFMLNSGISKSNFKITETIPISKDKKLVYYIFNFEKGHIVVSSDDIIMPILGYGLTSNIDFNKIPSGLLCLLNNYKDEILFAQKQKLQANKEINDKWNYYLNLDEQTALKSYSLGTYLLTTTWGQSAGYQQYCPDKPNSSIKCSIGCGGVALGQILKYWNCRVFPDGSNTYTSSTINQTLSVNYYNQDYDWQNMSINSPDDDNALLLYHSAVALNSNFCSNGTNTSSYTHNVRGAFVNYFGFNADNPKWKNNYSNSSWINMLKTEINSKRPIYYRGEDSAGGHAWVIDGYKNDNTFHCNWGWDGSYIENWYPLSALNAGGFQLNDNQAAILNIYPILDACSGLSGSGLFCSSNNSYSVSIPSSASVSWSKSSNLKSIGGNTGTTYNVRAFNSSQSGSGFVRATIRNSQGQLFKVRSKNVWIGKPLTPVIHFPFSKVGMNSYIETFATSPGATNYTWSIGGGTLLWGQGTDNIALRTSSHCLTDLTVRVTSINTCGNSAQVMKSIPYDCSGGPNPKTINTFKVSPNPAKDILYIEFDYTNVEISDNTEIKEVYLYNKMMSLVKFKKFTGNSTRLNLNNLKPDIYILKIRLGSDVFDEKIIVTD